jgi:hypothetical protein
VDYLHGKPPALPSFGPESPAYGERLDTKQQDDSRLVAGRSPIQATDFLVTVCDHGFGLLEFTDEPLILFVKHRKRPLAS